MVPALACIAKFLKAEMKCEPPWLKTDPQLSPVLWTKIEIEFEHTG
jgi:hypothetical protein